LPQVLRTFAMTIPDLMRRFDKLKRLKLCYNYPKAVIKERAYKPASSTAFTFLVE
jgi:hypothetical protein